MKLVCAAAASVLQALCGSRWGYTFLDHVPRISPLFPPRLPKMAHLSDPVFPATIWPSFNVMVTCDRVFSTIDYGWPEENHTALDTSWRPPCKYSTDAS